MELKQERGKKIHLQSTDSFSSAKIPQKVRFLSLHIHKRVKKGGGDSIQLAYGSGKSSMHLMKIQVHKLQKTNKQTKPPLSHLLNRANSPL